MVKRAVGLLAVFLLVACGNGPARSGAEVSPSLDASRSPRPSSSLAPTSTPSPASILAACKPSPLTASFARLTTSPPPPAQGGAAGAISGHVTTPSEVIVPQLVYALNTAGPAYGAYATETIWDQSAYTISGVAPGSYYLYATRRPVECQPGGDVFGAIYSRSVSCGLSVECSDHTPVAITVRAGATTPGIDPIDWYLDTPIPAPPLSLIRVYPPAESVQKSYPSAQTAATAFEKRIHEATFVDSLSACPINRACFWIGDERDGDRAAYFVGAGGSNGNWVTCATYVFQDAAGWHGLTYAWCGAPYRAVGQGTNVHVGFGDTTTCVNVRSAPAGPKTGCVKVETLVRIDEGPAYAPLAGSNGLWWHLAGLGWMADDFLAYQPGP